MFNIKDLLQITRQQKIVISFLLVSTTVLLTAYLVYLFVRDLSSPLVPVVSPAVQYLWVVLSGWGGLLLIGQGDSPRRIASLADEFLEKIFPESFGALRFFNTRESENKALAKDAMFPKNGPAQLTSPKWTYQVNHYKGSPFAFYKFAVQHEGHAKRPVIRLFVHLNQPSVTVVFLYCLNKDMADSNTKLDELIERFGRIEESYGYKYRIEKNFVATENLNINKLILTKNLADEFINSGKHKLAFSHDVAMMTHALISDIETDSELSRDLMKSMHD